MLLSLSGVTPVCVGGHLGMLLSLSGVTPVCASGHLGMLLSLPGVTPVCAGGYPRAQPCPLPSTSLAWIHHPNHPQC
jgi:hypothetical protein